jgi:hypothetical protein
MFKSAEFLNNVSTDLLLCITRVHRNSEFGKRISFLLHGNNRVLVQLERWASVCQLAEVRISAVARIFLFTITSIIVMTNSYQYPPGEKLPEHEC